MDSEEIKLIKKISEGDEFAFEHLFRTYHASLFYYAKSLTHNEEISKEIVNDVFLKFWDKRASLTIRTSIKSYLYISVRNRFLNLLRQKNDWLEYQSEEDLKIKEYEINHGSFADSIPRYILDKELESKIHEIIDSLPEQCSKIFKMSRFEDMKSGEIAEKLGLSIRTIDNQIYKALKKIRELLENHS